MLKIYLLSACLCHYCSERRDCLEDITYKDWKESHFLKLKVDFNVKDPPTTPQNSGKTFSRDYGQRFWLEDVEEKKVP